MNLYAVQFQGIPLHPPRFSQKPGTSQRVPSQPLPEGPSNLAGTSIPPFWVSSPAAHKRIPTQSITRIPFNAWTVRFAGNDIYRVATYNVKDLAWYSAEATADKKKWAADQRDMDALREAILAIKPNILAVQEVRNREALQNLNQELGHYFTYEIMFPSNDPGKGVAIFSTSKLRPIDVKTHADHVPKDGKKKEAFLRDFLEVTYQTPNGFRFTVFNTHWKSMRGGAQATQPQRMREALAAQEILNQHYRDHPDTPVLVMGDFNTLRGTLENEALEIMEQPNHPNPKGRLVELTEHFKISSPTHYSSKFGPTKLDYFYGNRAMLPYVDAVETMGEFDQMPWINASDHLPIVATINDEPGTGQDKTITDADAGGNLSVLA